MAVNYVNRKCDCGGKLEFNKNKKVWVCLYCGSEIEREESYDGMFTIKNVVRQTLLDIAYRRLDGAEKNLTECEKIDSRYIGTIIANLCYLMIKIGMPESGNGSDLKGTIAKIKRYNDVLQKENEGITDEEESLYEFFDTSDIYATLLLVYDSLNDEIRSEHMKKLLKSEDVFSKEINKNLLNYSISRNDQQLLNGVIRNSDNIDKKHALSLVLEKSPDNENKVGHIQELFQKEAYGKEDKELLNQYFEISKDSAATKAKVVTSAITSDIRPGVETIIKYVLAANEDIAITKDVSEKLCSTDLSDEEVNKIMEYCFACSNIQNTLAGLNSLLQSGNYVTLNAKYIISMLSRTDIDAEAKKTVLDAALQFHYDNKTFESILNNYLCFSQDTPECRSIIIPFLLQKAKTIPTGIVENYLLKTNIDVSNKPEIMRTILSADTNLTFYYDLLSKYILTGLDAPDIKKQIIELLSSKGIKADPSSFSQYICGINDGGVLKADITKILLKSGSVIKNDTLSRYLTELKDFNEFNSELFALMFNESSSASDNSLINYILYCKDLEAVKARNSIAMIDRNGSVYGSQLCHIRHHGNDIDCNLLQAYLLISQDPYTVTAAIINQMVNAKVKINAEMRVSGAGMIKLKKYIVANRAYLSPLSEQLCEEYKVFNMLF